MSASPYDAETARNRKDHPEGSVSLFLFRQGRFGKGLHISRIHDDDSGGSNVVTEKSCIRGTGGYLGRGTLDIEFSQAHEN